MIRLWGYKKIGYQISDIKYRISKVVISSSCLFIFQSFNLLFSQESKSKSWSLNGYIKEMPSYTNSLGIEQINNLVHNRLNLKWYPGQRWKFIAELRTRVFLGDQVDNPFFINGIESANDYSKLSWYYNDPGDVVFHTMLDRLYLQYTRDKLEVKLGRQRINWGINTIWNPNDIFNAFSYFDFDYEERPGSDAALVRYYTGIASSIEIAGKMADSVEGLTAAAMWKYNNWGYDVQVLGGVATQQIVFGGGWAGNLKKAGFKGEASYFIPMPHAPLQTEAFVGTISLDYSFKNSLYLIASVLYNSDRSVDPSYLEQLSYYQGNISARNLSAFKWSAFINAAYQFHPLVNGGLALIGYPGTDNLFLGPSIGLSLMQNLDLSTFGQVLFSSQTGDYTVNSQAYFLRLKYSF